jgi:predicted aspartyl protease
MSRAIFFVFITFTICTSLAASPAKSQDALPFRLFRGYLVLVPCSVAGHSNLTAVVDTGTTETVLSLDLARQLSLPTRPDSATSLNAEAAASAVSIPDLQVGSLKFKQLDGIAMDLSQIAAQLGIRPDLILGMDALASQSFTIDYLSRVVRFGPAPSFANTAPLLRRDRFLVVETRVVDQSVALKLDTGFNGLLLYANRVGTVPRHVATAQISGVGQASEVRSFSSWSIQLGNWRSTLLAVAVLQRGPRDLSLYDGLLGPSALGAKRICFDFDNRVFSWE